jgi:hypothetical protein
MKKLSDILLEEQQLIDGVTTPTLILFGNVLDTEKVLQSPEVDKIVNYFFGKSIASVLQPDNAEQLNDYFRELQYKEGVQGHAMIYPFKANFEDLTLETYGDQYSGPAYIQINTPEETAFPVLTITCQWNDGVFRNDFCVIGAVIDAEDLKQV